MDSREDFFEILMHIVISSHLQHNYTDQYTGMARPRTVHLFSTAVLLTKHQFTSLILLRHIQLKC